MVCFTLVVEPLAAWTVRGDDVRLSQVFYNVLDNAIKYTPRGGQITVRGRAVDDRVEIEIEDTGSGISPQHMPHVFKRFYQADPARADGGFGLGLSLAETIAQAHGASLDVRSEEGAGSTFKIVFRSVRDGRLLRDAAVVGQL